MTKEREEILHAMYNEAKNIQQIVEDILRFGLTTYQERLDEACGGLDLLMQKLKHSDDT